MTRRYIACLLLASVAAVIGAAVSAGAQTPIEIRGQHIGASTVNVAGGAYELLGSVGTPVSGTSRGAGYELVSGLFGPQGASVPAFPFGDVNRDGFVNAVDVQLVINAALGIPVAPGVLPDLDGDNAVNAVDVQLVINAALGVI